MITVFTSDILQNTSTKVISAGGVLDGRLFQVAQTENDKSRVDFEPTTTLTTVHVVFPADSNAHQNSSQRICSVLQHVKKTLVNCT